MERFIFRFRTALLFIIISLSLFEAQASHIMAGDLTYKFIGGLDYELKLKLYRDCNGVDLTNTATIRLRSSCYSDSQVVVPLLSGSGDILPLICPAQQSSSSCLGGNLLGVREYIYRDTITLPTSCFDWQFSWTSCCRNAAITNLSTPSTRTFYLEAYLNHEFTAGNSSPSFGSIPTPYICLGQPFAYTQGSSELDGDSLVYKLVSPQTSAVGTIPFVSGFSATQPISPSVTIHPNTGQLFFTPNTQQVAVVGILVEEYRNDSLIGSTRRDLQVIALNCNNTFPILSPPIAINLQTPAVQSSPLVLEICPDNVLQFELQGIDLDFGDSVYIESVGTPMIGVNVNPSPGLAVGSIQVDWLPTAQDIGTYIWEFTVRDNNCPLLGIQRYALTIKVLERTQTGPDVFYCPAGGPVQLQVEGGSSFVWTELNGALLAPGELSCDSCPAPLAAPTITTTYVVTSDLGNCLNTDTITVHVVPDIVVNTSPQQDSICRGDTVELSASVIPGTGFTYTWQPQHTLLQANSLSPRAAPKQSTQYIMDVTSAAGCRVKDTLDLFVINLSASGIAPKDKVCRLDSSVRLQGVVSSNVPYASTWRDPLGAIIGNFDSIQFTALFSGLYSLTIQDSTQKCETSDSVQLDVLDMVVLPATQAICPGDSALLGASYLGPTGLIYPPSCGPTDSCCGPKYVYQLGDTCFTGGQGCLTSGFQSSAYRGSFVASRVQYLYREAELQAAGFLGGTIESLSFHMAWALIQGRSDGLDELVIKMGCTDEDSLLSFEDGLTTVWGPAPFDPQLGFNTHNLDLSYDYPGVGNLIIQICSVDSTNTAGIAFYETSASTYAFPTTIKADRFVYQPPCELDADTTIIYERPMIRLSVCVEGLDPVYTWTPSVGLSNPNIANPKASPSSNTTYTLNLSVADSCVCQLEKPVQVTVNGCVLDYQVIDFQANKINNGALLHWKLAEEGHAFDWWIEQQIGGNFIPICQIQNQQTGHFHVANLAEGEHLFRLRLDHVNGNSSFSEVKSVFIESKDIEFSIFPNPVKQGKHVFFPPSHGTRQFMLHDMYGKILFQHPDYPFDFFTTQNLPVGNYLLQLGERTYRLLILE